MSAVAGLDGRLAAIAGLVRRGTRLADVGCDHGHLICALAADGVIMGGIACDVNEKPLAKAAAEAERLGLSNRVFCRVADGLDAVGPDEADDVVVAGMGGELIAGILSRCPWAEQEGKRFLLQPMTRAPLLRDWLAQNGYELETERACRAAGRIYTVMAAFHTGQRRRLAWDDLWLHAGALPRHPSREAALYISRYAATLRRRASGIAAGDPEQARSLEALAARLLALAGSW